MRSQNSRQRGEASKLHRQLNKSIPVHLLFWAVKARDHGGRITLDADDRHGPIRVTLARGYVLIEEQGARQKPQSIHAPAIKFRSPFAPGHAI